MSVVSKEAAKNGRAHSTNGKPAVQMSPLAEAQMIALKIQNREFRNKPPGLVDINRLCELVLTLDTNGVPWATDFIRRGAGHK
jgi:hypothetical protein